MGIFILVIFALGVFGCAKAAVYLDNKLTVKDPLKSFISVSPFIAWFLISMPLGSHLLN